MTRILLVDDQASVRQGLRMRLGLESDVLVVGEAASSAEALAAAQALAPDVIVLDVEMPGLDGVEVVQLLRKLVPEAAIVMLTIHDDAVTRARAEEACVAAFVSKQEPFDVLLDTLRQVGRRGRVRAD